MSCSQLNKSSFTSHGATLVQRRPITNSQQLWHMAEERLKKFKNDPEIKHPYAKSIQDDNEKS